MKLDKFVERARMLARPHRVEDGKKFPAGGCRSRGHRPLTAEDKPRAKEALAAGVEALAELQDRLYAQDRWARAADLPGDGRGRQGRRDQARDVGRQPAGLPGHFLQGALGRGARPRLPVALRRSACPSAAASASSTAPTTKRCWSCACTPSCSRSRSCPPKLVAQGHLEGALPRTSATSSATWRATASSSASSSCTSPSKEQKRRFLERLDDPAKNWKFSGDDVSERGYWKRLHEGLRGHDPPHRHASTRRGTWCPRTTSGSRASSSPRPWSTRWPPSTSNTRRWASASSPSSQRPGRRCWPRSEGPAPRCAYRVSITMTGPQAVSRMLPIA